MYIYIYIYKKIIHIYIYIYIWCDGYHCRKWTRRLKFKSWMRLIAFHIPLIPLGKVWIQLFSLQLWVKELGRLGSSALVRQLVEEKKNPEFKPLKLHLKNWPCVISCPSRGVSKYIYILYMNNFLLLYINIYMCIYICISIYPIVNRGRYIAFVWNKKLQMGF